MEMGGNYGGWEKSQNFWFTAQANDQPQVLGCPNIQIRHEVGEAVKTAIQPLISELVEVVRFQRAQQFSAFIPEMVKAVRGQCAQEFEALVPIMVEEMKKVIHSSGLRSASEDTESSTSRSMRLQFVGNMPDTLYTYTKVQPAGDPLMVELCDSSGNRVEVGPESSAKVGLVVLNGDFEMDDRAVCSKEDFDKNKVQPRKDKGPLLKGEPVITLSKGVACISDVIIFTDNSKLMRSGTFRLGAEFVGGEARGVGKIAFKVKERRLISYAQKPSLEDSLCRLRNIGDKNAKKLATMQVHTVRDFLQLHNTDAKALQEILRIPEGKFSETIKHAESWPLTKDCYKYHDETQGVDLMLDCVFNILSVTFKGLRTQPYEILGDSQKELVNDIRCNTYKKRSELRKTLMSDNHALVSAIPASIPSIECVNMQYTHAIQDLVTDQFDLDEIWASLTPLPDESGAHHLEASTSSNSRITGKLKAACNVTKAAIMFMISVQEQDSGAPRKKQKKMTLFFKQNS